MLHAEELRKVAGCVSKIVGATATLGTSPTVLVLPQNVSMVSMSAGGAWQLRLSPKVKGCMKTADNAVTFTNYIGEATDGRTDTYVTLSDLNTAAELDYWYVGLPCDGYNTGGYASGDFNGLYVDVVLANSATSTLSCKYWNGAWTTLSITDNTVDTSRTLYKDGTITWTAVTDAVPYTLNGINAFWLRFQVSVALDSSTTLAAVVPMTSYTPGYFSANVDYTIGLDAGVAGLEVLVASGTPTLNVAYYIADRN